MKLMQEYKDNLYWKIKLLRKQLEMIMRNKNQAINSVELIDNL